LGHLCQIRGLTVDGLKPDYATHLHDPMLLPDIERACSLIGEALTHKWHVTIFGDYDADGTPAAALLSMALTELGIAHAVMLPTRQSGYGLRLEQVESIAQSSQLLITVDTGVSAIEEIKRAKELGLSVIVLDHHLPPPTLPNADAVIDPHRLDSLYPFADLCGCALAYKFVVALGRTFPALSERFSKWLLDLVAVSTVADMMPIIDENRALVHYGLVVLRQNRRPGFKALLDRAGLDPTTLTASALGFAIGPRLNAAGRLGDNSPALELLRADASRANDWAVKVEAANTQRQALVQEVMEAARASLFQQNDPADFIYILGSEGWPAGVVGLVAGKLSAEYARPVLVATFEPTIARGSARSIEQYPIVEALGRQTRFLDSFGGHTSAAGFTLQRSNWDNFVAKLKTDARSHMRPDWLRKTFYVDAELERDDVTHRVADELELLQPHGLGNYRPTFLLRGVTFRDTARIGRDGRHLRSQIRNQACQIEGIAFGQADQLLPLTSSPLNIIGHLEVNRWRSQERLQFQIIDYKPAGATVEWIAHA
jgi:single-stranded-DNA-specific exonuclease